MGLREKYGNVNQCGDGYVKAGLAKLRAWIIGMMVGSLASHQEEPDVCRLLLKERRGYARKAEKSERTKKRILKTDTDTAEVCWQVWTTWEIMRGR